MTLSYWAYACLFLPFFFFFVINEEEEEEKWRKGYIVRVINSDDKRGNSSIRSCALIFSLYTHTHKTHLFSAYNCHSLCRHTPRALIEIESGRQSSRQRERKMHIQNRSDAVSFSVLRKSLKKKKECVRISSYNRLFLSERITLNLVLQILERHFN